MIPLIPTVGVMTNSVWGYYITASQGYTIPTNIPTWNNTNFNGAWSPARQAPNGHSYAFPLCAPCPIKIYTGSANSGSSSTFSSIPQIQFITTSIDGNDLFLPTPSSTNVANYEKFYSPILAQDGCFYAFDYSFVSASGNNIESTRVGKIMKLDPSIDRYTTYSFSYPVVATRRMSSNILGYDGYIYGTVSANNGTGNNRIFRFDPTTPTNVQSSSILSSTYGAAAAGQFFGTLSSRPGAIYWIPRNPGATNNISIVLSSSLFSPGTINGISTIPLPSTLTGGGGGDLAYWPSKGHVDTGYTYWSPRINTANTLQNARVLVLDPYGGTAGTGSLTLDNNTNIYDNNGPVTSPNFTFGFARSINGDLFALPTTTHTKSIAIDKDGTGSVSNFYPINNNISLQYTTVYPNIMSNGINIWSNVITITKNTFPTTNWNYFMSVKGYYKNVTDFIEYSYFSPPSNIASITSSLYNWLENNTSGN